VKGCEKKSQKNTTANVTLFSNKKFIDAYKHISHKGMHLSYKNSLLINHYSLIWNKY